MAGCSMPGEKLSWWSLFIFSVNMEHLCARCCAQYKNKGQFSMPQQDEWLLTGILISFLKRIELLQSY
jgi:hypothetical protein